jgi:hypothetical protein
MKKKEKGIRNEETLPGERHSLFPRFSKIKQISLQVDRTRSLFPAAAEEATSHAAGTWSVRKTQSLLPQISPPGRWFFC